VRRCLTDKGRLSKRATGPVSDCKRAQYAKGALTMLPQELNSQLAPSLVSWVQRENQARYGLQLTRTCLIGQKLSLCQHELVLLLHYAILLNYQNDLCRCKCESQSSGRRRPPRC
jgi:hypothetical protein